MQDGGERRWAAGMSGGGEGRRAKAKGEKENLGSPDISRS